MMSDDGTVIGISAHDLHAILAEKADTEPQLEGESNRAYKMRVVPGYAEMEMQRQRRKRKSPAKQERERVRRAERQRKNRAAGTAKRTHGRYDGDSPPVAARSDEAGTVDQPLPMGPLRSDRMDDESP